MQGILSHWRHYCPNLSCCFTDPFVWVRIFGPILQQMPSWGNVSLFNLRFAEVLKGWLQYRGNHLITYWRVNLTRCSSTGVCMKRLSDCQECGADLIKIPLRAAGSRWRPDYVSDALYARTAFLTICFRFFKGGSSIRILSALHSEEAKFLEKPFSTIGLDSFSENLVQGRLSLCWISSPWLWEAKKVFQLSASISDWIQPNI